MKKSDFWKIIEFVQNECDSSTFRWFEGLSYLYALNSEVFDEFISAFSYFDEEE